MLPSRSAQGALVFVCWLYLSVAYYTLVYLPPVLNVGVNLMAAVSAGLALALLHHAQSLLKIYVVAFSLAFGLSSLQLSIDQPAFTADFILFALIHLLLLGVAIGAGSMLFRQASTASVPPIPDGMVNVALYVFLGLAAFVALSKGVRLTGFLNGVKTDGNLYKIGGLSGLQGVIMIFLLCCFSFLTKLNRAVFLVAVCVIAILDIKRGEIVRVALFLLFYVYLWLSVAGISKRRILLFGGLGAASLLALVIGGEVRQQLYSPDFSISAILKSRLNITAVDWIYGYFGITMSVLQRYFEAPFEPSGFFGELFRFALTSGPEVATTSVSINGFNAGSAFSVFAGNASILPSPDFIFFCVLVATMAAVLNVVPAVSLRAFVMLQIFGFVFGNQLILPYYLAGFFIAAFYIWQRMLVQSYATADPTKSARAAIGR